MSWEQVTRWKLTCDGPTTNGKCPAVFREETEDGNLRVGLWAKKQLTVGNVGYDACGRAWRISRDAEGNVIALCPAHGDAEDYMAAAKADGLPFDEPAGTSR